ncbi:MAG: threonine--tRNA ligase, partial [Calditrichia bacterium]|nr:threonine--tRNA ligase [Calditrichia bacterium]
LKEEFRAEIDSRNEKVGYKIREAEVNKTPYMIIVGDQEAESEQVSVRQRGKGDLGKMDRGELFKRIKEDVDKKQ